MDHNLEDQLTMESIEHMDFEDGGVEVEQEDIPLEDSQEDNIHMDMGTIEEQPILMEGGSEEVIVSDFISDQFGFEEYSVQTENSSGANVIIESNQLFQENELTAQDDQNIEIQYAESAKPTTSQTGVITIKAIPQQRSITKKSTATASYPRQVAIAPKPIKGAPNVQYAIAPKPVAIMVNKGLGTQKTIPMKGVVQGLKGNTVLAQIGKQLVMVPAGAAGQKLKLASVIPGGATDTNNIHLVRCSPESAQLLTNKGGKSVRTKFIVQGQNSTETANQPAVITKIMPVTSSAPAQTRYIMQQKTVPISIGGSKVVLTTPTKQGVKVAPKKQIISIKTENPKLITTQANMQTKKVVITANPTTSHSKPAGVKTITQIQGHRTQLHPINVPGKGIQYIKLVTNQQAVQKATSKPQSLSISGKNFVFTDSKGNIIQMSSDKVLSSQPPPLLITANTASATQVAPKGRKLVKIAPISAKSDTSVAKVREVTKMAYCVEPKVSRASQSLLMPREQTLSGTTVSLEEFNEMVDQTNLSLAEETVVDEEEIEEEVLEEKVQDNADIKPTLASLISDAVAGEESVHDMSHMAEIEIEYDDSTRKHEYYEEENTNSMDHESSNEKLDEKLIILPSTVTHNTSEEDQIYQEDSNNSVGDNSRMQTVVSVEADVMPYLSPEIEQNYSESMLMFEGSGSGPGALRPRKACNCTKSQCLKLYCDCFANGEFCNQCNCNNCFNNLDHEDTRQKAIRACLERNPNAFRPKIGKSKSGGPEIVRRHNKGCNCKRSGCLKNYCECYEAKIACTLMCKCVGCRNIEETMERRRDALRLRDKLSDPSYRAPLPIGQVKQPCNFMTCEVIEAVAQCMLAAAGEDAPRDADPIEDVLLEFSRCMADIITASHHSL